jgi:hypothetical protein
MGLFDGLRRKQTGLDESLRISGIRLKVRSGKEPLPSPLVGAYVTAFTVAEEQQQAVKQAVLAIFAMGYDVEEVLREGLEFPMLDWGAHVAAAWPDFPDHYPTQDQIATKLANGGVVFSPFAGFDQAEG